MVKHRVIPVILLRNGHVVQASGFRRYRIQGNPSTIVSRLSSWNADELVYLDISRRAQHDLGRSDLNFSAHQDLLTILEEIAAHSFMPLAFGGGIRTLDDVAQRLARGADKVVVNTIAHEDPAFVGRCAREHGSQCVVVSVDARQTEPGAWEVVVEGGRVSTGRDPAQWAHQLEDSGAGEILINNVERDGRGQGYDLDLLRHVRSAVRVPVVALGGAGRWEHLGEGLDAGADAVAAGNIFHNSENSLYNAMSWLHERGYRVRSPSLGPAS